MADLKLSWGKFGVDGATLTGTQSEDMGGMTTTVTFHQQNPGSSAEIARENLFSGLRRAETANSGLELHGDGGAGETSQTIIEFSANFESGFSDQVGHVSFRISDIDTSKCRFADILSIYAYDSNENEIAVRVAYTGTEGIAGHVGAVGPNDDGLALIEIGGRVAKIVIQYKNTDYSKQRILLSDIFFSAVAGVPEIDALATNAEPQKIESLRLASKVNSISTADREIAKLRSAPTPAAPTLRAADEPDPDDDYERLDIDMSTVKAIVYNPEDPTYDPSTRKGNSGTVVFHSGQTVEFDEVEAIVCYTPNAMIATPDGEVPAQSLHIGDRVITRDNGIQTIRWIGTKALTGRELFNSPHLRPVLIRAGALGNNLPERDKIVSPNQRMLVSNDRTSLLFEEREVLVAAKHLVNHKGIQQLDSLGAEYTHMLFDSHEIILADGTWMESFQPGDYSANGLGNSQRNELFEIYPNLRKTHGRQKIGGARRPMRRTVVRPQV